MPPPTAGSIMVTADESVVIDPEFAFYGPMAFDVAKVRRRLGSPVHKAPAHVVLLQGTGLRQALA